MANKMDRTYLETSIWQMRFIEFGRKKSTFPTWSFQVTAGLLHRPYRGQSGPVQWCLPWQISVNFIIHSCFIYKHRAQDFPELILVWTVQGIRMGKGHSELSHFFHCYHKQQYHKYSNSLLKQLRVFAFCWKTFPKFHTYT